MPMFIVRYDVNKLDDSPCISTKCHGWSQNTLVYAEIITKSSKVLIRAHRSLIYTIYTN